ncbi:hypothetical protein [Fuerstiella marisgermanici]|uniref:Lipoprotein n=1 Tax=Fuerstiella marisgermanici TaxID=1891926 RepID=A0A1P8WKN5_9PLAN|nr:hypothetical protein [Fuerstiella marisgermanici]APZ94618.1 hypothetical protein Fuma_04251 [Fuerstiella marisgermanici]
MGKVKLPAIAKDKLFVIELLAVTFALWQGCSASSEVSILSEQLRQQKELHEAERLQAKEQLEFERVPFLAFSTMARFEMTTAEDAIASVSIMNETPVLRNFGRGPAFNIELDWRLPDGTGIAEPYPSFTQLFPGESDVIGGVSDELFVGLPPGASSRGTVVIRSDWIGGGRSKFEQAYVAQRDISSTDEVTLRFGKILRLEVGDLTWHGPDSSQPPTR